MDEKNIIHIDEKSFEKKVINESTNRLVIVDFWAPWCGPCKQLTPVLEKIISKSPNKIVLVKINIDENQQLAAQLRIQSIPAVFAFKEKQVVNAFQGVISEKDIINFLEQCLGDKLDDNFDDFYQEVQLYLKERKFDIAKEKLEIFLSENSQEAKAISLYAECLIDMDDAETANEFLNSIDQNLLENEKVQKIIKRIDLINQKKDGPSINELKDDLIKSPDNLEIVFKIADLYFANNEFDNCFEFLLKYYPKHKDIVKTKLLGFFDVLGFENKSVIIYRKKLSSIMFL